MVEIWGVFEGLKFTVACGYSKVEINIDSKKVIDAINMAGKIPKYHVVGLVHIFREVN